MNLRKSIQRSMSGIILASVGIIFAPGAAVAQEPSAEGAIEEIIVSARKRDERLQDVPIAVTAIGSDLIEREQSGFGEALDHLTVNPLPHTLMLTAIVVSVSTTGVALALLIRIHRRYGTLDEAVLLEKLK